MSGGKSSRRRPLAVAGLALGGAAMLSGCSYVASFFPDKQKEYRYSTELPPLEIPPDLLASTVEGGRAANGYPGKQAEDEPAESPNAESGESSETTTQSGSARPRGEPKASAPTATLAQGSDDVPLIEVEAPYAEAWNDVSRALGRLEVEVTDQNRSDGVFYVYFGGETKKYEDRGLWQDFTSLFSGGGPKAQEFRLKLEDKGELTNIFVLDSAGQPVSDGVGMDLLKRLHEKLQTLDKPEPESETPDSKDEQ